MDQRSPSFEASLLYRVAPSPIDASVLEDLTATIEINGEYVQRIDEVSDMFTVLTCRAVQVLLAIGHDPLPVNHFLNANRPSSAHVSESQILARLTSIVTINTVLVVDREPGSFDGPAASDRIKRDLCWDITECLFDQDPTDLIFWSDDDMLYADEEFELACMEAANQPEIEIVSEPEPANVHWIFDQDPMVDEAALAGIGRSPRRHAPAAAFPEYDDHATVVPFTIPDRISKAIDLIQTNLDPKRAAHGTALACTAATITMTALPNIEQLLM